MNKFDFKDRTAAFSYDGSGDAVSIMLADCENNKINVLERVFLPKSLGHFYSAVCNLIGFDKFGEEYKIVTAPGPSEIKDAKNYNAVAILDNEKALDISQLTSLIKESSFVVANDTGPAHIAAHVGAKGLTLFGKHTTAYKVNIERENFKAIQVEDLNNLSAEKVFERVVQYLS